MPQSSKYCTRHGIERNALTRIRIQNSPRPKKFTHMEASSAKNGSCFALSLHKATTQTFSPSNPSR